MNEGQPIRLFLTINERLYRDALLYQLMLQPGVDLVGESSTGVHTLDRLHQNAANVLIIDENLSDNDGLTISEIALSVNPSLAIMLLTERDISQHRLAIYLEAGIKTVVSKSQSVDEFIKALHYIKGGQVYVNAERLRSERSPRPLSASSFAALSEREQAVAMLMAERVPVRSIAEQLGVSHKTVHSYKDRIFVKMGFERLPELVLFIKRMQNEIKRMQNETSP